jgi:hypothetical protein
MAWPPASSEASGLNERFVNLPIAPRQVQINTLLNLHFQIRKVFAFTERIMNWAGLIGAA